MAILDSNATFYFTHYKCFLIEFSLQNSQYRYKSWKRRWFILNDNCLYYFEYTTDKEPRGIIPLENISVKFGVFAQISF